MNKPIFKFALVDGLSEQWLPTRAEPLSSGWDVRVALPDGQAELIVKPMDYIKISLGFRAFCPEGWWLELKPRSSTFAKKHLHALYGTIDETYEGTMVFAAQYLTSKYIKFLRSESNEEEFIEKIFPDLTLIHGEAIGQLIPIKRKEMIVESISNKEYDNLCKQRDAVRKDGGFGSTSK